MYCAIGYQFVCSLYNNLHSAYTWFYHLFLYFFNLCSWLDYWNFYVDGPALWLSKHNWRVASRWLSEITFIGFFQKKYIKSLANSDYGLIPVLCYGCFSIDTISSSTPPGKLKANRRHRRPCVFAQFMVSDVLCLLFFVSDNELAWPMFLSQIIQWMF